MAIPRNHQETNNENRLVGLNITTCGSRKTWVRETLKFSKEGKVTTGLGKTDMGNLFYRKKLG